MRYREPFVSQTRYTTRTAARPNFDLAILFVHGIGKQRPSDTLIAGAVPLVEWLKQQNACQEIRLTEGRQKATGSPAYAVLEGQVSGTPIRWLLAESCWADEFHVPEPLHLPSGCYAMASGFRSCTSSNWSYGEFVR